MWGCHRVRLRVQMIQFCVRKEDEGVGKGGTDEEDREESCLPISSASRIPVREE